MKKIIAASLFLALALSGNAQTMSDAINYSQNHYYGTARTLGLNNAVTAVGGDLGTVGINPAGSAVSGYAQFTITPGLSISSVGAAYSPSGESSFGLTNRDMRTRFTMPNIGLSMNFDTGRINGLKRMTFAVVANRINDYNCRALASGRNSMSSKLAEFANAAYGWDEGILGDYDSFNYSDAPWDVLTAYQAGMFGSYEKGGYGGYVGNSEVISDDGSYHYVPGPLVQTSGTFKTGHKTDLVFNFAMNFSDKLFVGFNLGLPTGVYNYGESFFETPVNPEQFPISFADGDTYFTDASYSYKYVADMTGIYAKIGAIYLPNDNLRIGAAIQTPTAYTIKEAWQYGAASSFDDSYFSGDQRSPEGEYEYGLVSPYVVNAGLAYTFGSTGFISLDYEMDDFSVMKYREYYGEGDIFGGDAFGPFREVNSTMNKFCGVQHHLRLGGEYKPLPMIALRAGIGLATTPERYWRDASGNDVTADNWDFNMAGLSTPIYYNDKTMSYSLGFGYSSPESFFWDIAARLTTYPDFVFAPYFDYDGWDAAGNFGEIVAPRVLNNRSKFDVLMTFGWRF